MSYDLWFYFRASPTVPKLSEGIAVTLSGPHEVDSEEIPEEYRRFLSGRKYCLTVSGSGVAQETFDELERIKSDIVAVHPDVVILDHQSGKAIVKGQEVDLPRRSNGPPKFTNISLFFDDGVGFENEKFETFIDLMERHIPRALPRRYGSLSGPMFTLAKTGLTTFKSEWRKETNLVWHASAPFQFVSTLIRNDARKFPNGLRNRFATDYLCSCIELLGDTKICKEPTLLRSAYNFLAESAVLTGVFYAAIWDDAVAPWSWWWQGIPAQSPLVAIVGAPYLDLWPEFRAISRPLSPTHRIASTVVKPTTEKIEIPSRLADSRDQNARTAFLDGYAPVFPFNRP